MLLWEVLVATGLGEITGAHQSLTFNLLILQCSGILDSGQEDLEQGISHRQDVVLGSCNDGGKCIQGHVLHSAMLIGSLQVADADLETLA